MHSNRPRGVLVVAALAFVFGLGEIYVGVTGNYLGILSRGLHPSIATAIVGAFYSLGGLVLFLTRRAWGTVLSIALIGAEVIGRAYLVDVGIAPSNGPDFDKIIVGGIIASLFMCYIYLRSFYGGGSTEK